MDKTNFALQITLHLPQSGIQIEANKRRPKDLYFVFWLLRFPKGKVSAYEDNSHNQNEDPISSWMTIHGPYNYVETRLLNRFWASTPISVNQMSFWSPILDAYLLYTPLKLKSLIKVSKRTRPTYDLK